MKFVLPEKRFAWLAAVFVFVLFVSFGNIQAQSKKPAAKKPAAKAVDKKTTAKAKDAKKDSRTSAKSKTNAKDKKSAAKDSRSAKNDRNKKQVNSRTAKNDPKAKKLSKAEQAKLDTKNNKNKKKSKKELEAERRAEARRKAEEAARIAEQRRREEAARIARERKLAFERGLKTETQANILKDSPEGEDLRVRQTAIDALGDHAGTVVVMESQTGKIVTMVNQDWAIRNSFKPCSTIKLVTGVAGVSENVITQDGAIVGENSSIGLDGALAHSKNPYFQRAGVKMGSTKMVDYARKLGLGQKTGINADGETPGRVPFNNNNPRIYSHGDDFEVTPLQLAVMVSALANDGKKVVPHISKPQIERAGFRPQFSGKIDVPKEKFEGVLPGMMGAAEYGTARRGVDPSLGIAGKTGSCIGKGSWVGLFASVAPVENPKYAVVVITRGEGERGRIAAGIAHRIYRDLAPKISRDLVRYASLKRQSTATRIDSQTAETDDEDDDDALVEALTGAERNVIVAGSQQQQVQTPKKMVVKTAQSKPVFSPVVIPFSKESKTSPDAAKQRPRVVKNEK